MDAANHSLLEQILERQPSANVPAPDVSIPGAPVRTVSLKEIADMTNRVMKNKGWSTPYVTGYQDRDDAVLELNPKAWNEQKKQLTRDLQYVTFQDLAKVFEHTGRRQCSVKVDKVSVGRFYRSRLEGWVWEASGDEPARRPDGQTVGLAIILGILIMILLVIAASAH